ncbi:MAG: hypothetical protein J6Z49_05255 [Kiritimatiellae bacterium]|nr:hypothetical protein [Kiritimatiellia bacterium]
MKKVVAALIASAGMLFGVNGAEYKGNYIYAGLMEYRVKGLDGMNVPVGLVTVKVGKPSTKKTCKVTMDIQKANVKRVRVTGELALRDDGELTGKLGKGADEYEVEIVDEHHFELVNISNGMYINCGRNYLEGPDAKAKAAQYSPYVGVWNAQLTVEKYGDVYVNCVVSSKGIVQVFCWGWNSKLRGACKTRLVACETDYQGCSIPINFMKLAEKKTTSAAFSLRLTPDEKGIIRLTMDKRYTEEWYAGCYAINGFTSFQQAADEEQCKLYAQKITDVEGGKGVRRPNGEYVVHGDSSMFPLYNIGDVTAFGYPVIATLGYPLYGTPVKVNRLGWFTPKATKVTVVGPSPIVNGVQANPCGLKLTPNFKTHTFKGSYYIYTKVGGKLKKSTARINGVTYRIGDGSDILEYVSRGFAYCVSPNGKYSFDHSCMDPPNNSGDDDDDDDE